MRKFAPALLLSSITAVVCGSVLAATGATHSMSPDKATGSPSVEANTDNPQALSYGDKSNTSPGTNAKMDGKTDAAMRDKAAMATAMEERDETLADKIRKHRAKHARTGDAALSKNTPTDTTNGAAAKSLTGTSPGGG